MKKIISGIIVLVVGLMAAQTTQAQGTITYVSNLGQSSTGNYAVGSDSWYAAFFSTGSNASGYLLNSIQLGMTDASGNPSGFTAMIYTNGEPGGISPGGSIGTLNGSANPSTSGNYTYTDNSNLTLSPNTPYFIVLTAGTTVANGAYDWSLAGANSYNPSGGWSGSVGRVYSSGNGSSWTPISAAYPQFAINATAVPEPSELALGALGAFIFSFYSRKGVSKHS